MAKHIVDRVARVGIPDAGSKLSKVVDSNTWGDDAAVRRGYGQGVRTYPPPADKSQPEDRGSRASDRTFNDVSRSWLTGGAPAENKPGYVPGYKGHKR